MKNHHDLPSDPLLLSKLSQLRECRRRIAEFEESRNLQRLVSGAAFARTDERLTLERKRAAELDLEASSLAQDAGLDDQARSLLREYSELDHLVRSVEQRMGVRR